MKGFIRTLFIGIIFSVGNIFGLDKANANPNQNSPLGMNTDEALEVDASLPFVDLFRLSLPFDEARPWFTRGNVVFDKNGWPKNLNGDNAGTRFLCRIPMQILPQGECTVLYEDEGNSVMVLVRKWLSNFPVKTSLELLRKNSLRSFIQQRQRLYLLLRVIHVITFVIFVS